MTESILRPKSPSEIQYIFIPKYVKYPNILFPPDEFKNNIIEFVRHCPKDLIQLSDAVDYYEFAFKYGFNNAHDLSVVYDIKLKNLLPELKLRNQLKLFFIDGTSPHFKATLTSLQSMHSCLHFYCLINVKGHQPTLIENNITDPYDFINSIIENQQPIMTELGYPTLKLNPSLLINDKRFIDFQAFIPTRNNYFMINGLIGNFMTAPDTTITEDEIVRKTAVESQRAQKKPHSFDRQKLFISQIKKLDFYISAGLHGKVLLTNLSTEPVYAPLVIIAPFHNPDVKTLYQLPDTKEIREIFDSFQGEQTGNYVTLGETDADKPTQALITGIKYMREVLTYLDNIGFLHASNWYSPVIRLPLKGKSIYRELSFFRTSAFAHLSNTANRKNLQKTINKFSTAYKKGCISPEFEKILIDRNRQIILISDLPLEWLSLQDIPFAFTHDICRLPVSGYRGLMANYAINSQFAFKVSKNILRRSLVIFGSDGAPFKVWQDACIALGKEKGFAAVYCDTIDAVKRAIREFNPELLIFDCHGSYDQASNSTFLWIGNERLTNERIVKDNITAPLIFLSACGTAPTYGTINTIANAFFETGCLSVTTTYLPVEINSSSILYLRLLNKLEMSSKKGLHKNWLEFVSHVIRTSAIMEKFQIAYKKSPVAQHERLSEKNSEALLDALIFEKRRTLYNSVNDEIKKLTGIDVSSFSNIIPEYLFYSNLGRGDLVYFDVWLTDFRKKNNAKQK